MHRAQSLFVKATLSHEPEVARVARENLTGMLHHGSPARDRDDTTAAVVGVALVGLALLWAFSGSNDSSGGAGSGGDMPMNTGGAPFGGGSPSAAQLVNGFRGPPPPRPMTGNAGKVLNGTQGFDGVVRK